MLKRSGALNRFQRTLFRPVAGSQVLFYRSIASVASRR